MQEACPLVRELARWSGEAAVEVTCYAFFLVHGVVQAAAEMAGSWCYFLVCMGVACKAGNIATEVMGLGMGVLASW